MSNDDNIQYFRFSLTLEYVVLDLSEPVEVPICFVSVQQRINVHMITSDVRIRKGLIYASKEVKMKVN